MSSSPPAKLATDKTRVKHGFHWHLLLIHFPISAFLGAFVFMGLHLLTGDRCFARAAFVSLIAGTLVMIPTTATGWFTWKDRYNGVKGKLFLTKIRLAFSMIVISIIMSLYQTISSIDYTTADYDLGYFVYIAGVTLLLLGAAGEGYYGGRLHHS